MKDDDNYRSRSSSQIKIKTYNSVSDIFANGDSFEKILDQDIISRNKVTKRKKVNFKAKTIISFKRYCKTISCLRSKKLDKNNKKLSNSDIISELSKEDLNEESEDNSVYSLSQDESQKHNYQKFQSPITNIKNSIISQNNLNHRAIETINSGTFAKIMDYEGSNLIIETFFKKKSYNILVFKNKIVNNDSEKNKIKLILGRYIQNSTFLILNTNSSRENLNTNENCVKHNEIKIIDNEKKSYSFLSSGFLSVYEKKFKEKKDFYDIQKKLKKGLDLIPDSVYVRESTNRTYKRKKIINNKPPNLNDSSKSKVLGKNNMRTNNKYRDNEIKIDNPKEIKNFKRLINDNKEIFKFKSDEVLKYEIGKKLNLSFHVDDLYKGGRVSFEKKFQFKSLISTNISLISNNIPSQKYIRKVNIIQREWRKLYNIKKQAAIKIQSISRAYLLRKRVAEVTCLYYLIQSKIAKIEKIMKNRKIYPTFKTLQKIYIKQIKSKCLVLIKRSFHKFYPLQSTNNKSITYQSLEENFYSDTETDTKYERYKAIAPIIRISDNNLQKKEGKRVHFNLEEDQREIIKVEKKLMKKRVEYIDEKEYIIVECQDLINLEENNNNLKSLKSEMIESKSSILPMITYLKVRVNILPQIIKIQTNFRKFLFKKYVIYRLYTPFSKLTNRRRIDKIEKTVLYPLKITKIIKYDLDSYRKKILPEIQRRNKLFTKCRYLANFNPPSFSKKIRSFNEIIVKSYVKFLLIETNKKITFIQKEKMVNFILGYSVMCKKYLIKSTHELYIYFRDLKKSIDDLNAKILENNSKHKIYLLSKRKEKLSHILCIIQTFKRIKTIDFIFTIEAIINLNSKKTLLKRFYLIVEKKREHSEKIRILTELYKDSQNNFLETIKQINEINDYSLFDSTKEIQITTDSFYQSEEEDWWISKSHSKKV